MFVIINYKLFKMKKLFILSLLSITITNLCAQQTGTIKDNDKLTKIALDFHEDYATNKHELWDEMVNDDAEVHINNSKMTGKELKEAFKSHHMIFNNIEIIDAYAHTNYFSGGENKGDTWTNSWFTWTGTGNVTGIGYSNKAHFDFQWEKGKVIKMLCFFDTTALNMEIAANK